MPPRPVCARLGIKLPASEYIRPALHQLHHCIPIPTGHRSPEGMQSNNVTLFPFFLNTFQLVSSVAFLKYERMCGCLRGCHFEQGFGFLPEESQVARDETKAALQQRFSACGSQRLWGRWMALSRGSPKIFGKHKYLHYSS